MLDQPPLNTIWKGKVMLAYWERTIVAMTGRAHCQRQVAFFHPVSAVLSITMQRASMSFCLSGMWYSPAAHGGWPLPMGWVYWPNCMKYTWRGAPHIALYQKSCPKVHWLQQERWLRCDTRTDRERITDHYYRFSNCTVTLSRNVSNCHD